MLRFIHPFRRKPIAAAAALAAGLALSSCGGADDRKSAESAGVVPSIVQTEPSASPSPTKDTELLSQQAACNTVSDSAKKIGAAVLTDASSKKSQVTVDGINGGGNEDALNKNFGALIKSTLPRFVFTEDGSQIRVITEDPYFLTKSSPQTGVYHSVELYFTPGANDKVQNQINAHKQPQIQDFIDTISAGDATLASAKLRYNIPNVVETEQRLADGTCQYTRYIDGQSDPSFIQIADAANASEFTGRMQSEQAILHTDLMNQPG